MWGLIEPPPSYGTVEDAWQTYLEWIDAMLLVKPSDDQLLSERARTARLIEMMDKRRPT